VPAVAARATAAAPSRARGGEARTARSRLAPAALGLLCVVYALLAALPAIPTSPIVLGAPGPWPEWLLGPLRFAGLGGADGPLAGPLFYAGLWVALLLYAVVAWRARDLSARTVAVAIAALHVLFLLAPPLLSQDVFSYVAYARLGVDHGLDPYTHAPRDIPGDAVFHLAGSRDAESVYGPFFTLSTYALAPLGLEGMFWALKAVAALSSLGIVWLVWRTAERLGRDPMPAAVLVGLNPHTLVHVVGGAHNEALVVLGTMAGVYAFAAARPRAGAAAATAAAGIKASAGLVVPYLVLGARCAWPGAALAVVAVAIAVALTGLAAFGVDALDALGVLGSNQDRTSRWSFVHRTTAVLGGVLPGTGPDYRDPVRVVFAAGFAAVAVLTLVRTRRGADPIAMAGWATLALLVATAWLVPWYALWLLPLAALSGDRRLVWGAVALSAWMLVIAVPL
jgi:hypothetical protein